MTRILPALPLAALLLATPALADEFTPALEAYLASDIATWAADPVLLEAIRSQNAATAGHDQAMIDALDLQWRAEVSTAGSPLVEGVLHSGAADFLRTRVAVSEGKITEAFVTDAKGLNVAASDPTSDYWQGDEDKYLKVFPTVGGHHISDVELDESTQRYQGQISVTVSDPATGEALGTLTVGVDAESLM
ncbi:MAG: hypothetical protein IPL38_20015 [Rhodobacter sp.]|jgi:hypothetical protein|nr:hypothetical protein [Rhodobacter sp.]